MTSYYQPYWVQDDELEHFGIKGMKWGIRRYQNLDGTLTEAGKKRYSSAEEARQNKVAKLREKEYKIRDRATRRSFKAVENAMGKYPDTKFFKAEKNQLTKYIDEEAKSIKSLSDQELIKRDRGRKAGYTTAALIEIASAGSLAASLAMPFTPAGIAARSALGVTWIASFLGGAIAADVTSRKYSGDTSEYAKDIKEGKQWLGGKTLEYGYGQIARGEKKARESGKKSFTVDQYTSTGPGSYKWSTATIPIALIDKYIKD